MNGTEPRSRSSNEPPTVQSVAIRRGADELLKLFFTPDKQPKRPKHDVTTSSAEVQTDANDQDQQTIARLERLLAEEQIKSQETQSLLMAENARLLADLQSKDMLIAHLQDEIKEQREILGALQHIPESVDVEMAETGLGLDGELPENIADLSVTPLPLARAGSTIDLLEDKLMITGVLEDEFKEDSVMRFSSESYMHGDYKFDGMVMHSDCSKEDIELDLDSDSDDELFPYPSGERPLQPLEKPIIRFIPATTKLQKIRVPASPIREEEVGVSFEVKYESSEDGEQQ